MAIVDLWCTITQMRFHYRQPRLTASALARMQQLQGAEPSALPTTTTRSLYDVKAMQKEAVLSYVKVPSQYT